MWQGKRRTRDRDIAGISSSKMLARPVSPCQSLPPGQVMALADTTSVNQPTHSVGRGRVAVMREEEEEEEEEGGRKEDIMVDEGKA